VVDTGVYSCRIQSTLFVGLTWDILVAFHMNYPLSSIRLSLEIEQFGVVVNEGNGFLVGAVFDDFAVFYDEVICKIN